jgi:hypothetical protein
MICHEVESVRDGEWDVRDTVIGRAERGRYGRGGCGDNLWGALRPNDNLMESEQHLYAGANSFEYGALASPILSLVWPRPIGGDAVVVSMFTRRKAQNSDQASGAEANGTQRGRLEPGRYFFFFRGRRHSLQAAGSRSKNDSVLEFWFGAGVVLALVAIVVLVCLHSLNAVR